MRFCDHPFIRLWIFLGAGIAILGMVLGGCVATGTKVTEEQLFAFEKGRTTYREVIERLGPPTAMTLNPDMSRLVTYSYTQSQVRAVNYIPLVGAFLQGGDSEQTSVTFEFAPDGRLQTYSATSGTVGMGTGFSSGARQK